MIDHLSRFLLVSSRAEAIRRTLLISLVIAYVATFATSSFLERVLPRIWEMVGERQMALPFFIAYMLSVAFVAIFMLVSLRLNTVKMQLEELARIDPLTGLLNRRAFAEESELRGRKNGQSRGDWLLLLDADRFKSVNDSHGHAAGDLVLSMIAMVLKGNVFERDLVARIGGEEFAVYISDANRDGAARAAERIRAAIEENTVYFESRRIKITVSIGCARIEDVRDMAGGMARADRSLYRAKNDGRNCVVICEEIDRFEKIEPQASTDAAQMPAIRLVSTT